jgi:hypothetical protein
MKSQDMKGISSSLWVSKTKFAFKGHITGRNTNSNLGGFLVHQTLLCSKKKKIEIKNKTCKVIISKGKSPRI